MPVVSFSKESSEHSCQAFQKAQMGGGVNTSSEQCWNTLSTGTPTLKLGKWHWSHRIWPFLHLNNHRTHHSKLVMIRENTKGREQLTEVKDLKQCWGTTNQNKPKPNHKTRKLLEGWTTKSFSKTIHFSSTENKRSDKLQPFGTWRHLAVNSPHDRDCAKHCLQHYYHDKR